MMMMMKVGFKPGGEGGREGGGIVRVPLPLGTPV